MERRGFLKALLGVPLAAPLIAKALAEPERPRAPILDYLDRHGPAVETGKEFYAFAADGNHTYFAQTTGMRKGDIFLLHDEKYGLSMAEMVDEIHREQLRAIESWSKRPL